MQKEHERTLENTRRSSREKNQAVIRNMEMENRGHFTIAIIIIIILFFTCCILATRGSSNNFPFL